MDKEFTQAFEANDRIAVEVKAAITECVEKYNDNHAYDIERGELKAVTADDYAIFIRASGYAVILKSSFAKFSKKNKALFLKGCSYVSL